MLPAVAGPRFTRPLLAALHSLSGLGELMKHKGREPFELVLYISIILLMLGLSVSVFFYINTFSGGISNSSADWSALGSFFGGVFAPAVSFVTLVAIIITIRLQKRLLETQVSEFSKLHALQVKTLDVQQEQLDSVKSSYEYEKITSYKQTILSVISQQIDLYQKIIDRCTHSSEFMLEKKMAQPGIDLGSKLDEVLDQKEEYEKKLNELVKLSILIAVSKYQSTQEVDKEFIEGYANLQ